MAARPEDDEDACCERAFSPLCWFYTLVWEDGEEPESSCDEESGQDCECEGDAVE